MKKSGVITHLIQFSFDSISVRLGRSINKEFYVTSYAHGKVKSFNVDTKRNTKKRQMNAATHFVLISFIHFDQYTIIDRHCFIVLEQFLRHAVAFSILTYK